MHRTHLSLQSVVALILLLTGSTLAAKPVVLDRDPNLAGWWKFDETAGKTAADASAHGRDGTLKGTLSFDKNSVPGKTGKALKLEGGETLIEVAGYKGIAGTQTRTVAAWIKTTTTRGQIVSWGTDDFGQMWNFGFVRGRVGVTPHGGYLYINPQTHDDKWHHVAAVVQEAELPNLHDDVTLYLDGAIAEIHDIGLLDLWPLETGNDLDVRIGQGYKGCLDDLRIYDRALSDEEIQVLFRLESNRPTPETDK
jgi:Concanavalin A-like lectin/glucanases superfamily